MSARQALLPRVSERSGVGLETAAGVQQSIFAVAFLAGPAIAGILLAVLAPGQVLLIAAAASLGAAILTALLRVGNPDRDPAGGGLAVAWRELRRSPALVKLLVVIGLSSLITAPMTSVLLPTHFAGLGRPDQLGFVVSATAAGVLAGSGLFAVLVRLGRRVIWTAALLLSAVGLILVALLGGFWLVFAGGLVLGIGSGLVKPMIGVVFSERVPEVMLGRTFALVNALSLIGGPLGLAVTGLVVAAAGLPTLAWGLAAVGLLSLIVGGLGRGLRDLERPADPADPEAAESGDRSTSSKTGVAPEGESGVRAERTP